jgi:AAA15 family ATPase/GTPase
MLIEFRLDNFRSFGGEARLSLVANEKDPSLAGRNTRPSGVPGIPNVLTSALIYGANASGKSNLIKALTLMRGVVVESFQLKPEQKFNVQPFRLDEKLREKPTMFEVTLVLEGRRFQYGFEFTSDRIIREWLLHYETARPQTWFDRCYDPGTEKESFNFSTHFKVPKQQRDIIISTTRPNALFLSTAVQLNVEQLMPLHRWFAQDLVTLQGNAGFWLDYSTRLASTPEGQADLTSMLAAADIAITHISAAKKPGFQNQITLDLQTGKSQMETLNNEVLMPVFRHEANGVTADFEIPDESDGTVKLFCMAGPLLDILRSGKVLVIDEVDNSLHPLLVTLIVESFHNPEFNTGNAQLICTTHDSSQLSNDAYRRDQFWFTDKKASQMSELIPLTEYSPRKTEALERGYLSGRYGGVPILDRTLLRKRTDGKK